MNLRVLPLVFFASLAGQDFGRGDDAPAKWRAWRAADGKDAFKEAR